MICLSFFFLLVNDCVTFNLSDYREDAAANRHLNHLANEIVGKYFRQNKCLVVLTEKGLLSNFVSPQNTVIYLETESEKPDCPEALHILFKESFKLNCDGYIVQFRKPVCVFQGWFETYKQKFIPRHNPKYLFLPVYPDVLEYADNLLSMRISDISANILVAEGIKNDTEWTISLSTNNFFVHPREPGRSPKIFLDKWDLKKGFKYSVDLYPDKIMDLMGKPFRVATDFYPPYTLAKPLDGLENRISLVFCELRNCSPISVTDDHRWGTVHEENLTGEGVIGNIYIDKADIGTLAIYLWAQFFAFMDYTASYHSGAVTLMTPRPSRIGGWRVPFMPFSVDLWVAFSISLVASTLSLYFITVTSIRYTRFGGELEKKHQFTTIGDSSFRSIGLAVLQMPSSGFIRDSPNRYLFTSFEFLYLVLSSVYSAELSSFLTVAMYNPPIDTYHGFAQSGILWYGEHDVWVYSLRESSDEDSKAIVKNFRVATWPELKRLAKLGKYGLTAERLLGGAVTEQEHVTEDVIPKYHIMKEPIFFSPIVAVIKKGGPYNEHFNRIATKVFEHGLNFYWEADTVRRFMNYKIQLEYDEAKSIHIDSEPTVLELSHIVGTLYLYFIGIIVSVIVFLKEVFNNPGSNDDTEEFFNDTTFLN